MTQKAHNLDHLRQYSEFVPHLGIGNPSFVPGKSVVIQGKTTRFGGFALGTAEYKDSREKIRLWAGVLLDQHGVSYMVGVRSTYVSDQATQEMPATDAALRVLGGEYLRQPDGGYRHYGHPGEKGHNKGSVDDRVGGRDALRGREARQDLP